MKTVAGIFASREAAARAIQRLRDIGVRDDAINVLLPGGAERQLSSVSTDDGEQPGMGAALGAVAGGATGASIGLPVGAAISTFIIPGIGPIIAAGLLAGALFAAGGAAIGQTMERNMSAGLPRDELYVYQEALRRGKIVLFVQTESDDAADAVRGVLNEAGADSIDAAREEWWVGLRDQEAAAYRERGGDFEADEPTYRRGFEAAMMPFVRGRGYDVVLVELRDAYPEICQTDAFRCGFERGQEYDTRRQPREERAA
jgi:hypothetical protein